MTDKELEAKPYFPIYQDLMSHPIFCCEEQELMLAVADFIYQLGYLKITKDAEKGEAVND